MSFSTIRMLWLIWVLPVMLLVCVWGFRIRKKILSDYASERGLLAISPNSSPLRRWVKTIILLMVILLLAVCLAGPQYGYSWKKIQRRGVDLVIALDCSRSMLAQDIRPTRLERAKREVLDLLGMLQGDRVGLVAFAGTAFLQCPLTLDYEGFHLFLSVLGPDYLPVGGTDLAGAVTTAISAFNKKDATDKAVILITDGEATGADPLPAARKAADAGIKIFCIGVGGADGAPTPAAGGGFVKDQEGNIVLSRLDEPTLKKMAAITSGAYVRSVAGDMDLDVLYKQDIRGSMKKITLAELKTKVFDNRYQWFLALAVFLLLVELLVGERKSLAVWVLVMIAAAVPRTARATDLKDAIAQGTSAYASGNYDKAAQHFVAAQLEAPEKAEISYDLGNARYKAKDYDAAIQAYRQTLKTGDPELKEKALYNMGNAHVKKGDLDKAIENYEAALALDHTDVQARENLDFVKKLKAHPPRSTSKDQQKQKKNQKEDKKKQPGNQGNRGTQKKKDRGQNRQSGHKGHPSVPKTQNNPDQPRNPNAQSPPQQPKSLEQKQHQGQSADGKSMQTPDEEAMRQAETMLNRLQDQPGRAMIPAYRPHHVEKDW